MEREGSAHHPRYAPADGCRHALALRQLRFFNFKKKDIS